MGMGVALLPLAECIISEAANDCAGLACRFECSVGILVVHVCGLGKTPM